MTPFWKEERWGYNIYQNEQNLFFLAGPPPIPLSLHHVGVGGIDHYPQICSSIFYMKWYVVWISKLKKYGK